MSEIVWRKDFTKFTTALKPYVITMDGATVLDVDAPVDLTRPYSQLVSIGYANGWL